MSGSKPRETGWYWVKWGNDPAWRPAHYDEDGYWVQWRDSFGTTWREGGDVRFRPFSEVGPRIHPPRERTPAEVEARAFFEAYLDQLDPVVQRHVRALLGEGR